MNPAIVILSPMTLAIVLCAGISAAAADIDNPASPTTNTSPITSADTAKIYGPTTPDDAANVQALVDKWTTAPESDRAGGVVALLPRDQMETSFERAMQLNPDDYRACANKLYYLEPKWLGSPEAMLAFGRECVESQNWEGRLPLLLRNAHRSLAGYENDQSQYWRDPKVWDDWQSVYEPLLAGNPEDAADRSGYCYWACRTEHWDEAAKQFQLLGDRAYPVTFGGKDAMEKMRAEAKEKASK